MTRLPLFIIPALSGCLTLDFVVLNASPLPEDHQFSLEWTYQDTTVTVPDDLVEEVYFPSGQDDVQLHGLWARQPGEPKPPMIFFHGNAENLDRYTDRMAWYWSWGEYDVFSFDYQGFGKSGGEATEETVLLNDGIAAVNYVSEVTGIPPEQIPWVALSLGASSAAHTNRTVPAQSIVLESMFSSAKQVQDDSLQLDIPTGWFFSGNYDNLAALADCSAPTMVIHGLQDNFTWWKYGEEVYAAAPEPKLFWQPEDVDHSDILYVRPDDARDRILAWQRENPGLPQ